MISIHLLHTLSTGIVIVINTMSDYENAINLFNLLSASIYIGISKIIHIIIPVDITIE
ncbi:MAG: hypothetical protein GY793_01920 [Proteobacteria bacterium]|nr:hypothetical protein [Pseudomonadota bacterium]